MARVAGQAFAAEFAKRAGIYRQRVIKWKQKRGERGISDEKTAGKTAAVLLAALFCAAIAEEAEVTVAEPVVESLPETSLEDLTPPASDEPGEAPAATEDDAIVLATEDDAALAPEGELPPEAAAENAVGANEAGESAVLAEPVVPETPEGSPAAEAAPETPEGSPAAEAAPEPAEGSPEPEE